MKGCGKIERFGHGDYFICGASYVAGDPPYICDKCKIKALEKRLTVTDETVERFNKEFARDENYVSRTYFEAFKIALIEALKEQP